MSVVAVVVVAVLDPEVVRLVAPAEIEGLEVPLVEAELVPAVALVVIVELSESRSSHQNLKNFQVTEWECQADTWTDFPEVVVEVIDELVLVIACRQVLLSSASRFSVTPFSIVVSSVLVK
ncbi:unnamed protein product, partial [Mesorhabditis spiculigera]